MTTPNTTITVPIYVTILAAAAPESLSYPITVVVNPAGTPEQKISIEYPFLINVNPIRINISDPLINLSYEFLSSALLNYVDEDRELKTLLNYGEDRQSVVLAYRTGSNDGAGIPSIQLKLLQPVPTDVSIDSPVFLTREVAKTSIDRVRIRFAPEIDNTPYLRPKNTYVKSEIDLGKRLNNVTLRLLSLTTGSVGTTDQYKNKTFEDVIFRQWYSYDFNSSELNIDFTNYENFVFYGSAAMRLSAFREKLKLIERIENNRMQFASSSVYSAATSSAGAMYVQQKSAEYALEKENIIRSFDRYEQYLYFTPSGSNSPYSASAFYVDNGTEYNPIGYWPKNSSGSVLYTYDSTSTEWFDTQLLIAQRFDEFNENNLVNTIPTHVREHEENDSYITFVSMIGHFFDTIKPYIDQFPTIYSRDLNPSENLSKDLVNEIAESIGFRLPTLNSTFDLTNNILGVEDETPRRDLTAEIYKRLLHNAPFFAKAKGTKTALESLLKSFGITPELISVKETGAPVSSSFHVYEEFTTGIDFDEGTVSYVSLPIQASNRNPTTIQLNCTVAKSKTMTLLTGDNKWALNVRPHPSNPLLGRFELSSGSGQTVILSSSYQQIFGDELLHISLQNTATDTVLHVVQVEGEDILHRSITSLSSAFLPIWNTTQFIYAGGAGSLVVDRYDGTIDEIRLWNDELSDEVILNSAFDPGSNAGDTYQSAANNLLVELSFNKIDYELLAASSSVLNESPYINRSVVPSLETIPVVNVNSNDFARYSRTVKQDMILAGSSGIVSDKIRVVSDPVFLDSSSEIKTLYRKKSIVAPPQKRLQKGRNKVIVSMSPTTIVNQNIIRSFGYENINAILGAPTTLYTQYAQSLQSLKNYYQKYYYVEINTNRFIRILSEVNSILNQVLEYFIPSRATALNGIVIEPSLLDQVKIAPVKNIRFYGKNSRKTLNAPASLTGSKPDYSATFNVSDNIDALEQNSLSAKYNTYNNQPETTSTLTVTSSFSTIKGLVSSPQTEITSSIGSFKTLLGIDVADVDSNYSTVKTEVDISTYTSTGSFNTVKSTLVSKVTEIDGSYLVAKSAIINPDIANPVGDYNTYLLGDGEDRIVRTVSFLDVGLSIMNKVGYNDVNRGTDGSEPFKRLYPRKLFDSELNTTRNGGNTSIYIPALYDIKPSADFSDFGVYTYFNSSQGIYLFDQIIKIPTYQNPLNQSWDINQQNFTGVATWSYGARFNKNDVVYQNIDTSYSDVLGSDIVRGSFSGNKQYYVFKTKPSYIAPVDGTSFYSGSVPSYLPPSLDNVNWERLRFIPILKKVQKRVIFDTFTIPDPALNNFKTTTISVDRILDVPNRYVDTFSIPAISANSSVSGELLLQNIAALFAIQATDANVRIRLYRSEAARDADISRPLEIIPSGSHGVLVDTVYGTENVAEILTPFVTLVADAQPEDGKLYYTVNNLSSTNKLSFTLFLYYFAIQIEPKVPIGYLRKHYRFFRDNSTALKRRNYLGCKNTIDTTVDGLPPVQVFISEGTDITVSPTISNNEIITGGGGTLNVT